MTEKIENTVELKVTQAGESGFYCLSKPMLLNRLILYIPYNHCLLIRYKHRHKRYINWSNITSEMLSSKRYGALSCKCYGALSSKCHGFAYG